MSYFEWDPSLRAATLGHLNLLDDAQAALGDLDAINPDFASVAKDYIGRKVWEAASIDTLLEGSNKAGLAVLQG